MAFGYSKEMCGVCGEPVLMCTDYWLTGGKKVHLSCYDEDKQVNNVFILPKKGDENG